MHRSIRRKATAAQVEVMTILSSIHIWEETHESCHVQHKHDMEIGKTVHTGVKPHNTVLHKHKLVSILLLRTSGIRNKLSHKKSNAEFVGIKWNRTERPCYRSILQSLQLLALPVVELHVKHVYTSSQGGAKHDHFRINIRNEPTNDDFF